MASRFSAYSTFFNSFKFFFAFVFFIFEITCIVFSFHCSQDFGQYEVEGMDHLGKCSHFNVTRGMSAIASGTIFNQLINIDVTIWFKLIVRYIIVVFVPVNFLVNTSMLLPLDVLENQRVFLRERRDDQSTLLNTSYSFYSLL